MIDARIAALYARMDRVVDRYPERAVERMRAFALGTAFFPAGAGLVPPGRPLPADPVMFVAHVFDAPSFAYVLGPGGGSERTERNRTWAGLRALLDGAALAQERCFLTNALVGVKVGRPCGPVAAGPQYRRQCATFLREQVLAVRPRVIVTLGTPAMTVLKAADADLAERWHAYETLGALDRANPPAHVESDVRFGSHVVRRVVALGHSCSWASRRIYRGERGARADAALLRDALAGLGDPERAENARDARPQSEITACRVRPSERVETAADFDERDAALGKPRA